MRQSESADLFETYAPVQGQSTPVSWHQRSTAMLVSSLPLSGTMERGRPPRRMAMDTIQQQNHRRKVSLAASSTNGRNRAPHVGSDLVDRQLGTEINFYWTGANVHFNRLTGKTGQTVTGPPMSISFIAAISPSDRAPVRSWRSARLPRRVRMTRRPIGRPSRRLRLSP